MMDKLVMSEACQVPIAMLLKVVSLIWHGMLHWNPVYTTPVYDQILAKLVVKLVPV